MRDGDVAAVLATLRTGWLTMGPRIQDFEAAFAAWAGAAHAIAVSSGTAALHLAVRTLDLQPGDAVLVPAIGGRAAAGAVSAAGLTPVFGDVVAPERPVLDVDRTPPAKAAVLVHAFGLEGDPPSGLPYVEDRRALLSTPGATACFSFADGRPGIAMGEGGMVTTEDEAAAARVRLLRQHAMTTNTWDRHRGHGDTYDVVDVGFNFRLDEPRAALGISQLAHLSLTPPGAEGAAFATAAAIGVLDSPEGEPVTTLADLPVARETARRLRIRRV